MSYVFQGLGQRNTEYNTSITDIIQTRHVSSIWLNGLENVCEIYRSLSPRLTARQPF